MGCHVYLEINEPRREKTCLWGGGGGGGCSADETS